MGTQWLTPFRAPRMHTSASDGGGAVRVAFGVANTYWQVGEFANTESIDDED